MILVSDATIKDQKITTLLLFLPLACSSAVATLTSSVPWLGSILLPAVIFLAYYVRRFGQRLAALGMVAFLSLLIMLSSHAEAAQRPWLVITAGVVTGFAYLFRFVILPPRPVRVLRRSIAAFNLRAPTALDQLAESLAGLGRASTKRLRRSIEQLHHSGEDDREQLASPDSRRVLPPTELDRVGQGILEADLAVETMPQATVAALAEPLPADVKSLAGEALRNWVRGCVIRTGRPPASPRRRPSTRSTTDCGHGEACRSSCATPTVCRSFSPHRAHRRPPRPSRCSHCCASTWLWSTSDAGWGPGGRRGPPTTGVDTV